MNAIDVKGLSKTYRKGFRRRTVHAVKSIDFSVEQGECFGFLGPNGAGKTTTIRMLMGLISPTAGSATIFDHEIPNRDARKRLGFLPEAPYFYDYLSVAELLDFTGRLFGQDKAHRDQRADELIELVKLEHARNNPLKSYSKGMIQRAGIAQALMNDPDLVVFDEPMSGLDPIGRKEVRDIILSLKEKGKTVFFSSHILADVESVADRIAIIVKGEIRDVGKLRDIVSGVVGTEMVFHVGELDERARETLVEGAESHRLHGQEMTLKLGIDTDVNQVVTRGIEIGARLVAVTPIHETLEDVFIRTTEAGEEASS